MNEREKLLWPERRDLVHSLLQSLEDSDVLIPTTNADIEFGKWLKTQERDSQEGS
jgi:hypothetical protein